MDDARTLFPRGLLQPHASLHFGMDSLMLACACHHELPHKLTHFVDLGSGCGSTLFGLALLRPHAIGLGIEQDPTLVAASHSNCQTLGLQDRLTFRCFDLSAIDTVPLPFSLGTWDCVAANPPFYAPNEGRPSLDAMRNRAMRACGTHQVFIQAASRLLRHKGYFVCIMVANKLCQWLAACSAFGLGVRHLLPIASHPNTPAKRIILVAQKNAANDSVLHAPLVVHTADGGITDAARSYCPWL